MRARVIVIGLMLTVGGLGAAPDLVVADFEHADYSGWQVTGDAFGDGPARGAVGRQKAFGGMVGKSLANSFHADDKGQGSLTSPEFELARDHLNFRIGGGGHVGKTCMNLLVDGKVVRSATGPRGNDLVRDSWSVKEFRGKKARLQIVDATSAGWGFVTVDDVLQSDKAGPKRPAPKEEAKAKGNATVVDGGSRADFLSTVRMPKEVVISTVADKGAVVNPTALAVDDQNRLYVAESKRWRKGVEDNRNHRYWLQDDAALQSLEERLAMYEKWAKSKKPMNFFTDVSESVTRLADTTGDGKADQVTVFAEGFNEALAGTAGGLLVHDGTVYFSCIPSLYALRDTNDDGVADEREEVQRGFGIRVSISGHDMNAAVTGPDGKLYFSIGDRGYNFTTKEGKALKRVNSGAVFRCYPDGSEMELFFTTLRNPKELAFDEFGRLFTVDNDMNVDRSRVVYLMEGGDAGWHSGHQILGDFPEEVGLKRKRPNAWFAEGLWEMPSAKRPAYVLPPVAHFTDGPCGLVYNPGSVALPARYDRHFFVFDYRASPNKSGVRSFAVEEEGAGFRMVDGHDFIWGIAGTDVAFGRDGKLYLSDFVGGWMGNDAGYVYSVYDPTRVNDETIKQTQALFAAGIESLDDEGLSQLLLDPDMRVRQRAQFALAKRGIEGRRWLMAALEHGEVTVTRLHGLWGLGQQLRKAQSSGLVTLMLAQLLDPDPHVRSQAARIVGDCRLNDGHGRLTEMLLDDDPRVRAQAAIALGKLGANSKVQEALIRMLAENDNADLFLRHAGVMGLAGSATAKQLAALADHESAAVRLAAVLALRKLASSEIAAFVGDADPDVAGEVIRAINDENLVGAMPQLAAVLDDVPPLSTLQLYRVLNANFRIGDLAGVKRVVGYAADVEQSLDGRKEALRLLAQWEEPHPFDGTIAVYRPLPKREMAPLLRTIRSGIERLVEQADGSLGGAVARLARQYDVEVGAAGVIAMIVDEEADPDTRLAALAQLVDIEKEKALALAEKLLSHGKAELRRGALAQLAETVPKQAITKAGAIFSKGKPRVDLQGAYAVLATIPGEDAADLLLQGLEQLVAGKLEPGLRLDVVLAAEQRREPAVEAALERYREGLSKDDPLAAWRDAMEGGDPVIGEQLFRTHGSAQCLVCHKLYGEGGEVGPILDKIGARATREHLWESLVAPGRTVAPGFGIVSVTLKDGAIKTGTFMGHDGKGTKVKGADGKVVTYRRAEIASETKPLSGMPDMRQLLKPAEVRDVVEYLVSIKQPPKKGGKH